MFWKHKQPKPDPANQKLLKKHLTRRKFRAKKRARRKHLIANRKKHHYRYPTQKFEYEGARKTKKLITGQILEMDSQSKAPEADVGPAVVSLSTVPNICILNQTDWSFMLVSEARKRREKLHDRLHLMDLLTKPDEQMQTDLSYKSKSLQQIGGFTVKVQRDQLLKRFNAFFHRVEQLLKLEKRMLKAVWINSAKARLLCRDAEQAGETGREMIKEQLKAFEFDSFEVKGLILSVAVRLDQEFSKRTADRFCRGRKSMDRFWASQTVDYRTRTLNPYSQFKEFQENHFSTLHHNYEHKDVFKMKDRHMVLWHQIANGLFLSVVLYKQVYKFSIADFDLEHPVFHRQLRILAKDFLQIKQDKCDSIFLFPEAKNFAVSALSEFTIYRYTFDLDARSFGLIGSPFAVKTPGRLKLYSKLFRGNKYLGAICLENNQIMLYDYQISRFDGDKLQFKKVLCDRLEYLRNINKQVSRRDLLKLFAFKNSGHLTISSLQVKSYLNDLVTLKDSHYLESVPIFIHYRLECLLLPTNCFIYLYDTSQKLIIQFKRRIKIATEQIGFPLYKHRLKIKVEASPALVDIKQLNYYTDSIIKVDYGHVYLVYGIEKCFDFSFIELCENKDHVSKPISTYYSLEFIRKSRMYSLYFFDFTLQISVRVDKA